MWKLEAVRTRLALVLALCALSVGLLATPASAHTNCQQAGGGTALGVAARNDLDGSPVASSRGIAATIRVYDVFVKPATLTHRIQFTYFPMYISEGAPGTGDYIEFGWHRNRLLSGYGDPEWAVTLTLASNPGHQYVITGPITPPVNGLHRFKMWNRPSTGTWEFYIDDQLVYSIANWAGFNLPARAYLAGEATNSCNGLEQDFTNIWRYSETNDKWIHVSQYFDYMALISDANNHHEGLSFNPDSFDIVCDVPQPDYCDEVD